MLACNLGKTSSHQETSRALRPGAAAGGGETVSVCWRTFEKASEATFRVGKTWVNMKYSQKRRRGKRTNKLTSRKYIDRTYLSKASLAAYWGTKKKQKPEQNQVEEIHNEDNPNDSKVGRGGEGGGKEGRSYDRISKMQANCKHLGDNIHSLHPGLSTGSHRHK